ncbi:acyl carrier protein [Lachnospiraceae bacterium 62-35]
MKNLEKYREAFKEALEIDEDKINESLEYQGVDSWDSVGHMELVSELEDTFDIAMETDDIIEFSSYKKGIEILKKYGIEMEI